MDSETGSATDQAERICTAVQALVGAHTGRGCRARVDITLDNGIWRAEALFQPRSNDDDDDLMPDPFTPFYRIFRGGACVPAVAADPFLEGALDDLKQRVRVGVVEALRQNAVGFVALTRAAETLGGDPLSTHGFSGDPTASWPDVRVDATFGHVELKGCSGGLESIRLSAVGEGTPTVRLTPSEARTLARVLMLYADTHQGNEGHKVDGEDSPSGEEGEG